jgi:UDP-N-acetyl-2-amino-2-deoxyglucuronate dehydrogenase
MSQTPLKTAILGLNEEGRMLIECAANTNLFKVEAVADKDVELAQKIAADYDCRYYDDYRLAITQTGLNVVFAAAPLHTCTEYIHAALGKKLHVLRIAPPARTCEELAEFVHQSDGNGVNFAVAATLRFNRTFTAMREYLAQNKIENVSLVVARCGMGKLQESWQRDPKLAGGGVLLYKCYEMIDQIIHCFGMPDEVYAVHTSQATDRQQRLSVTEDTAVVTMKFADTLTINVIASKTLPPQSCELNIYGKEKKVFLDTDRLRISDDQNCPTEEVKEPAVKTELMSRLLVNFVQSIANPVDVQPLSSGTDHLKTMAVIESAYLSARTSAPESPNRILQMSRNTMTGYLIK